MPPAIEGFARFIAQAPNAVAMFDRDMRYLASSPRWLADFGLKGSPLGRSHYEVLPEIGDHWRAAHLRCLAGATETNDGDRFERADGSVRWVSWDARPWRTGDGAIGGIVIASVDVTRRVEAETRAEDAGRRAEAAERRLKDAIALLQATLHNTGEGIAVFGPDRRLLLHNALAAEFLDMPSFDPGALFEDIIRFRAARGDYGGIDADRFMRELVAKFDARTPWIRTRRQRSGRVTEVRFNPLPDGGGLLMYRDVTERADAEARLAERTALLEATLENMGEGLAVFGPDLTLLTFNRNAAQLIGTPPDLSRVGVSFEDLTRFCAERGDYGDVDVDACVRERTAQFRAPGRRPWSRTLAVRDGRAIETRFNPAPDGGGVYVYRDVTERERAEARIREEEAKFRGLVEQKVAGIVIVREDGTIGYSNDCAANMHGYAPAEVMGRPFLDFIVEEETSGAVRDLGALLAGAGAPVQVAGKGRARDGTIIELLVSASTSMFEGRPAAIAVLLDASERNRVQRELASAAERFRMLIEEAPDAILLYDYDQDRCVAANKAAERLFGVPRETLLDLGPRPFYAARQPDARPAPESFEEHNLRALAGEQVECERRVRRPSGEERVCRVTLVRLESKVRLLRGSFVDVTDRVAAEARLSEVLRTLVVGHEAERQRISRELHDSLGQYLAAANMKLETFSQRLGPLSPLAPGIAELKDLTGTIANEVSRLAWELRPIALDDLGLGPAIQRFVDEWASRSGLRFDVHLAVKDRRLPAEVETTLYRVLQEGVTNIVRHAHATTVGVILEASSKEVVMIIEDDGVGFDPDRLGRASPCLGLLGARERLAAIHGALEIETGPGDGTTLIARAPLDGGRADA